MNSIMQEGEIWYRGYTIEVLYDKRKIQYILSVSLNKASITVIDDNKDLAFKGIMEEIDKYIEGK